MVYKIRVILDAKEDIFRDIAVDQSTHLEDLHNTICQSFGFAGHEMASFYTCDEEWNQDLEIALFDLSEETDTQLMANTKLEDVMDQAATKLIYVYDFFSMWTFFVELADVTEPEPGQSLPELLFSFGELPETPPEKIFEAKKEDAMDFNEDLDDDDDYGDGYSSNGDYEDLDFDENWN
ncbi:MAG: hypothetical protein ACI9KR_000804 [Arcticibacterium sp.]|jgi:hypothetical protein